MLDTYGLEAIDLNLILMLYREVSYGSLKKLNVKGLKLIPCKEYKHIRKLSRLLPITSKTIYYGKPLNLKIKNKEVSSVLTLNKNDSGKYIYFISNIINNNVFADKRSIHVFNINQIFYQNNVDGIDPESSHLFLDA